MTIDYTWWKDSVVYQIWPASYKDSNGDGIGDIPGIILTLDYLKSLGVDVIWLSPMYESPQDDMGYDILDYEKVYSKYGSMEDMDKLIEEIHAREMRLILDLVVNHTSSEHAWFKESRSSKTNPKRDWYIWKPPKYDEQGNRKPPNNWGSFFSESAWTYDELTDEYYLHLFAESQPDLNWENEETRKAIYKSAMSFWLDKGVDGFRIDTAGLYSKHQLYKDAPVVFPEQDFQPAIELFHNGPRIHEFHKEMFSQVTSKYDAMTVGELGYCPPEEALKYVSAKEREMSMIFMFDVVDVGTVRNDRFQFQEWQLSDFKDAVRTMSSFIAGTDAWSTVFMENHDQPRSVTRFGHLGKYREKSGKMLAVLQATLTGTLFLYQGQEIGMTNIPREWPIEEYLDVWTVNYDKLQHSLHGEGYKEKMMDQISLLARDNARTPVQWDSSENAGFTSGKPWMRVNDNYKEVNVASQVDRKDSLLSFWKTALKVRKQYRDVLNYGELEILDFENQQVFTYLKSYKNQKAYVVLNFSASSVAFEKLVDGEFSLILSNEPDMDVGTLGPYEARVYEVTQ